MGQQSNSNKMSNNDYDELAKQIVHYEDFTDNDTLFRKMLLLLGIVDQGNGKSEELMPTFDTLNIFRSAQIAVVWRSLTSDLTDVPMNYAFEESDRLPIPARPFIVRSQLYNQLKMRRHIGDPEGKVDVTCARAECKRPKLQQDPYFYNCAESKSNICFLCIQKEEMAWQLKNVQGPQHQDTSFPNVAPSDNSPMFLKDEDDNDQESGGLKWSINDPSLPKMYQVVWELMWATQPLQVVNQFEEVIADLSFLDCLRVNVLTKRIQDNNESKIANQVYLPLEHMMVTINAKDRQIEYVDKKKNSGTIVLRELTTDSRKRSIYSFSTDSFLFESAVFAEDDTNMNDFLQSDAYQQHKAQFSKGLKDPKYDPIKALGLHLIQNKDLDKNQDLNAQQDEYKQQRIQQLKLGHEKRLSINNMMQSLLNLHIYVLVERVKNLKDKKHKDYILKLLKKKEIQLSYKAALLAIISCMDISDEEEYYPLKRDQVLDVNSTDHFLFSVLMQMLTSEQSYISSLNFLASQKLMKSHVDHSLFIGFLSNAVTECKKEQMKKQQSQRLSKIQDFLSQQQFNNFSDSFMVFKGMYFGIDELEKFNIATMQPDMNQQQFTQFKINGLLQATKSLEKALFSLNPNTNIFKNKYALDKEQEELSLETGTKTDNCNQRSTLQNNLKDVESDTVPVLFAISIPNLECFEGISLTSGYHTAYPNEQEVLFNSNARFYILKVEQFQGQQGALLNIVHLCHWQVQSTKSSQNLFIKSNKIANKS